MARRKKLGIVPRLLKGAVTVGVIPACAVAINEGCSQRLPPVVAAMGNDDGRMPPVVAAYMPPPALTPDPMDGGPPDASDAGDAGDAGTPADAGRAPTGPATVVPTATATMRPPVVAAYPRGNGDPRD